MSDEAVPTVGTPEGFPFYMTPEDDAFFRTVGFSQVSGAEFRRFGAYGKQSIELMVGNEGYWTAHYGAFWEGPRALTCQAAFIAAELANWGGARDISAMERLRIQLETRRQDLKNNFTG